MKFEIGDVVDYFIPLFSEEIRTGVVVEVDNFPFGEQYYTVQREGKNIYLWCSEMKMNKSHRRKNIMENL